MSNLELKLDSLIDQLKLTLARLESGAECIDSADCSEGDLKKSRSRRLVEPDYGAMAEQMYFERRKRDEIFPMAGVFGEPAWDMLLDLMIAWERGQKLSVTAVTQGSASAATTALRYLTVLEGVGLVERRPDPNDGRRVWLHLTEVGHQKMVKFFDNTSLNVRSKSSVRVLETGEMHLISG